MTIDELLERARSTYRRVSAAEAAVALAHGGVIIDTRTYEQRRDHGIVPGAMVLSRNVLEWRVDPGSGHSDERITGRSGPVVVMCQEGYSSSLAAATLVELGVADATDLIGGFESWAAAGLPIAPGPD